MDLEANSSGTQQFNTAQTGLARVDGAVPAAAIGGIAAEEVHVQRTV